MWIPLEDTLVMLLITATLFYSLPPLKIEFKILIILIWLGGFSWLLFLNYKTNPNEIYIPSQYSSMEI